MSTSKNQIQTLGETIRSLEQQRKNQYADLNAQMTQTYQYYTPANLIKENIKSLGGSALQKTNLIETAIGLLGSYFSKKIVIGTSKTFTNKLLGFALQYTVFNFISKKIKPKNTSKKTYNNTN